MAGPSFTCPQICGKLCTANVLRNLFLLLACDMSRLRSGDVPIVSEYMAQMHTPFSVEGPFFQCMAGSISGTFPLLPLWSSTQPPEVLW